MQTGGPRSREARRSSLWGTQWGGPWTLDCRHRAQLVHSASADRPHHSLTPTQRCLAPAVGGRLGEIPQSRASVAILFKRLLFKLVIKNLIFPPGKGCIYVFFRMYLPPQILKLCFLIKHRAASIARPLSPCLRARAPGHPRLWVEAPLSVVTGSASSSQVLGEAVLVMHGRGLHTTGWSPLGGGRGAPLTPRSLPESSSPTISPPGLSQEAQGHLRRDSGLCGKGPSRSQGPALRVVLVTGVLCPRPDQRA